MALSCALDPVLLPLPRHMKLQPHARSTWAIVASAPPPGWASSRCGSARALLVILVHRGARAVAGEVEHDEAVRAGLLAQVRRVDAIEVQRATRIHGLFFVRRGQRSRCTVEVVRVAIVDELHQVRSFLSARGEAQSERVTEPLDAKDVDSEAGDLAWRSR